MKSMRLFAAACAATLFSLPAVAQVTVTDPWVRGTVQGQMATGAFMKLQAAKDAKLIEARSPVAGVVEIHEMAMENNVMRMRAVKSIELPPGFSSTTRPAGKRETIEIKATARAATAQSDMMKKRGH